MPTYTDRKVHQPLADKLGESAPLTADFCRYSEGDDLPGIAAQRAAHCSVYASDDDIATIAQIPVEAWDPKNADLTARYGITWLTLNDIHHEAVGTKPLVAFVHVGSTVFFSISLSSTERHIKRLDGEDLNGATQLILSVLNHFRSIRQIRFAEDTTRANRDPVGWTETVKKCQHHSVLMLFGGQSYDPTVTGDNLALAALGMVTSQDDTIRRRRLTGKRLMKYKLGGAAMSEAQMPLGWRHKRDEFGWPVREGERGLIPEADPALIPVITSLYRAHANGESYQRLAQQLVAFESDGVLKRRDHKNRANTYASTSGDIQAQYDAAKSIFGRSNDRPRDIPTEAQIQDYLAGQDPADVFDADTRLYIGKVELVRTGRFYRRLTNDIVGRNIVLDGIPATYRDELDQYGWFDVLSASWGWPTDSNGEEVPAFGLDDDTCRQVAARLLRELRTPRAATGGRAHRHTERRAIMRIDNWTVAAGDPNARYADDQTEWGIEARQNVSGSANFVLLHRRASVADHARQGWSNLGQGESKPEHTAATGSLSELCASVAWHLDLEVRSLLDDKTFANVHETATTDVEDDPAASLASRAVLRQLEFDALHKRAEGLRGMAADFRAKGDLEEAAEYGQQAKEVSKAARDLRDELSKLGVKIDAVRSRATRQSREDLADVSVAAYLVAGLERAAHNNGTAPARLGALIDETITGWRFRVDGDDLHWNADVRLPLASGGTAELPLAGVIRNVRTRRGKALANSASIARYVFDEGRDLDSVADLLEVTRRTLLVKRVMPWLVDRGVTSRGGKCALVDHPISAVRREIFAAITEPTADERLSPYRQRVRRTYLDPSLRWGDAAVPDETTWIADALRLVTETTELKRHGMSVRDLALSLGRTEGEVRELVKPQHRAGGFTRPRFLAYANKGKTKVKAIGCPHGRCKGRRHADHVVLLPEVAASGYGIICRNCRRTPATYDGWELVQFTPDYLSLWTSSGPTGSLRTEARTSLVSVHGTR